MIKKLFIIPIIFALAPCGIIAQHKHEMSDQAIARVGGVPAQPLLAQVNRLEDALGFLGSNLTQKDRALLKALQEKLPGPETVQTIQEILDPYCLLSVDINPEARVMVSRGPASAELTQGGWSCFLVKVHNRAGSTAKLEIQSKNGEPLLYGSHNAPHASSDHLLKMAQVANRFLELAIYRDRPMQANLSGLELEYDVLEIYTNSQGRKEAEIGFNIGEGSQDIAFRNSTSILFDIHPAKRVELQIIDDDGQPAMASLIITDSIQHMQDVDYHEALAEREFGLHSKRLTGIYPLPSRRMAETDEYPDFFFQPQIYRSNGEHILLPPGHYRVRYTRGPEYLEQVKEVTILPATAVQTITFHLKRWIDMDSLGWYSADHHIHAAGCSHYESPEEGVPPSAMFRQITGEGLSMASVLSWGPGWYHQKSYFTGQLNPLSTARNLLRYDVEVSGFPSSHCGHLVLLNLKEDDYPNTKMIEDWPSWTLPILDWAKGQGAITGYAHSGWGLEPVEPTTALPNYIMPNMQGIGANEYIVTVTQQAIDFYSAGDTPAPWELNMWYHTLNCGLRPRLSGETDFPCIFDERVGLGRSYFKPEKKLDYAGYIEAIKNGRSYISDGRSHIIDFTANALEMGTHHSALFLDSAVNVKITANVAAYLDSEQTTDDEVISSKPLTEQPYWNTERARINKTRNVAVELIVNGESVDKTIVAADGTWRPLQFTYLPRQSCWIALRIYPAVHTNPIFVTIAHQTVNVKKSAEWCRQAVDQCWKIKEPLIRQPEKEAASAAYDRARAFYDRLIKQAN